MDDTQVGWIAAIIIGGVAGWLAELFMKSEMGILMNIVLGGGGGCQRHFELLWGPPRGMDWLPDCRVHRRGLADLDRAGGTGDAPASLRSTNRPRRQVRNIPHRAAEAYRACASNEVITFSFERPPRSAASSISNQARYVR